MLCQKCRKRKATHHIHAYGIENEISHSYRLCEECFKTDASSDEIKLIRELLELRAQDLGVVQLVSRRDIARKPINRSIEALPWQSDLQQLDLHPLLFHAFDEAFDATAATFHDVFVH